MAQKYYTRDEIVLQPAPAAESFIDKTGWPFGHVIILGHAGKWGGSRRWWAECDCGRVFIANAVNLTSGSSSSCGCRKGHFTHRQGRSTEFKSFNAAKNRCSNRTGKYYHNYGGRGIEFRFDGLSALLSEIGLKPTPAHTIDRINNNGHYEPGNVRWATRVEQGRNKRDNRSVAQFSPDGNLIPNDV